jgi:hypothetical protein
MSTTLPAYSPKPETTCGRSRRARPNPAEAPVDGRSDELDSWGSRFVAGANDDTFKFRAGRRHRVLLLMYHVVAQIFRWIRSVCTPPEFLLLVEDGGRFDFDEDVGFEEVVDSDQGCG